MGNLIAIDGNSLLHRAYYALPSMTTRDGIPTGALHGFLSMLIKLLERQPDYLLVAFDMHGPTFRHETYPEYKAGRRETPDDLRTQFPLLKEILTAMGIAICECPSYEADDILGTFGRRAAEAGENALLVTGDRDALQLVSDTTHVLLTKRGITETIEYDPDALMSAYGLTPDHMRDLKGLMGDSSDNIPGIPGVGEKTALKLLGQYGTLEEVLAHGHEIKGKLGEKVTNNADLARLSYRLGTIDVNAPLEMTLTECAFDPQRLGDAAGILQRLELRAIYARLPGPAAMKVAKATPQEAAATIRVEDEITLGQVVETLKKAKRLALALAEDVLYLTATGADQYAVSFQGTLLEPGLNPKDVFQCLIPLLENPKIEKMLFDAKWWMHAIDKQGGHIAGVTFDAMIVDYLCNAIRPAQTLQGLLDTRLGPGTKADAAALFHLYGPMMQELRDNGLYKLYEEVELPLIIVLYDMEREGFAVDADILRQLQGSFSTRIEELAGEIYELAGERFNILSTKQLGNVLFEKLGLPAMRKTKTGYSTDADVLEQLSDKHPIVALVQEYRFLTKLKSTFVDGLLNMLDQKTGRVYTSFNQNVTATGRISSTEPNLQNIPVRTALGREIRKAFVASPGRVLLGADYSQIELRLLAHISGDQTMINAFLDGGDIHTRTASEVFHTPLDEVTPEQRSAAKAVNFGIVYGISGFGLARNLSISRKQAEEYISRYLERYPKVHAFMLESVQRGKEEGCVRTLMGRIRALPELKSGNYNTRSFGERVAMNMPIQGTAADIIKLAMVRVHRALAKKGFQAKLILQVHDELIVDTPIEETDAVSVLLKDCMQDVMKLSVPLLADVKTGQSWFETK